MYYASYRAVDTPIFVHSFLSLTDLDQTGFLSYAILDLKQDLGLPVVQLAQLVKLNDTSCKLAHITVIHSSQNALLEMRRMLVSIAGSVIANGSSE